MTVLITARLRLEPFEDGHLDGLNAMNADPEVMRYLTGRPETREDLHSSTAGDYHAGTRSWVKIQSVGRVKIRSARTHSCKAKSNTALVHPDEAKGGEAIGAPLTKMQ
jgi:Acetyltransferase (GNAT) domain